MLEKRPTCWIRRFGLQYFAYVAPVFLILCHLFTFGVCRAEGATDPYDVLYDVIMTRHGKDGKSYTENEASPVIFKWSDFPFGDRTFQKFNTALDAFAALPQAGIEAYSDIKRALLQRHLWKVFDATAPHNWQLYGKTYRTSHPDRRDAVRSKIALLIKRLALTRTQILALPNTMEATVKSGGFAPRHDPGDRFKPFLPADIYSKESSWISFGEDYRSIPADIHSRKLNWRSTFLQFMRVPGGRIETLKYIEKLNGHKKTLPVGTQFVLIEQAFLISDEGKLILSPLIVSIQLRAYLDVNRSAREARPEATQCVAEFVMQPRELMEGNAVMKAMNPLDHRYEAGDDADGQSLSGGAKDPFETGEMPITRLNLCMKCHGRAGFRSIATLFSNSFPLFEVSPETISKVTSKKKRDDNTWKALHELWQAESKKQQPAKPGPLDRN